MQFHHRETVTEFRQRVPVLRADARLVLGADCQDDVLVMQDVVVFEIMQQGRWCCLRIASQENRSAGHTHRRMGAFLFHRGDESLQRHVAAAGLGKEDSRAALPGGHDDGEGDRQQNRHVAAVVNLQQVRTEEDQLQQQKRRQHGKRQPDRPLPAFAHELKEHQAGDDHRARDGNTVGGGQRIGTLEGEHQSDDAEQQDGVDGRQVDLPGIGFRSEEDFHARQVAEMDGLTHQRKRACYHRLAGDDGGGGGENDGRQDRPLREHQVKRIGHRRRVFEHQRALPEIIQRQRREHQTEPCPLDGAAAEMAEIGIKRFGTGDRQEHRAEHDDAVKAFIGQKLHRVPRIEGKENAEIIRDMNEAGETHHEEPDRRDRPEEFRHRSRAMRLDGEKTNENADGYRNNEVVHSGRDEFQALHRRQHRQRRRDHRITQKQRRADEAEHDEHAAVGTRRLH